MKTRCVCAIILSVVLPLGALAQGTTLWTNFTNADNSWLNTTNWNNGLPASTLTAAINFGSAPISYAVNHDSGTNDVLSVRMGLSTTRTATLNIDAGTMLNVVGPGGGDLASNTVVMANGARLNVSGTMIVAGGIFASGDSIINIDGGVLVDSNRLTRLNNTARMNITGGGMFIDTSAMDLGGAGGAEDSRLNIMNGAARVSGLNAGFRGTGVVAVGASGALTNLNGDLILGGQPPTGSWPGRGFLYSTGTVYNTGNLILGNNTTNNNAFGMVVISGGTFQQVGDSTKSVRIGDRNAGFLTVEGGAFLSTNNMVVGNQDRSVPARNQRGDGTVLVTGTGALAVTNAGGNASITLGTTSAVADSDRAIGRLTVAGGSLNANVLRIQNGVFTNSGGTSTIGNLIAGTSTASIAFTGGTLNLGASTISNGQVFVIGNGVGAATLNLVGNGTHSFANGLLLASNSLMSGIGNIAGNITNFGTIAPGNSPGTIGVAGDAILTPSSLMLMELGGTNAGEFDQFNVSGILGFDGTLTVTLTNGFAPQVGDIFDLFDFGSTNGLGFDTVNLPDLVNAAWDTTDLYVGGSVAVVIPEPGTLALLAVGAGLLLAAKKRTPHDS